MNFDQIQLLIYQHVVQLTLIDVQPEEAFALAYAVAARAFDEDFTREGLAIAVKSHRESAGQSPSKTQGFRTQPSETGDRA